MDSETQLSSPTRLLHQGRRVSISPRLPGCRIPRRAASALEKLLVEVGNHRKLTFSYLEENSLSCVFPSISQGEIEPGYLYGILPCALSPLPTCQTTGREVIPLAVLGPSLAYNPTAWPN